jgi:hypothetical protein
MFMPISYPRKCTHCDYLSNNPAMYSYHKKTHDSIPHETLCHFGCGFHALFRNTGGKYTCKEKYQECPAYLNQLSDRTRSSWKNSDDRKDVTKQSLVNRLHNQETIDKIKETKKQRFGILTPEAAKDYRHYARRIRHRAQQWAKSQGYILGQQTYHVDHKLSVLDAWHAGLPASIVNHPANLQILEARKNSIKGSKSSITVEELLAAINQVFEQE